MKNEDRQTNNLENKEIYFTIIFGFLIRGIESKFLELSSLSGPTTAKTLRLEYKGKSNLSSVIVSLFFHAVKYQCPIFYNN